MQYFDMVFNWEFGRKLECMKVLFFVGDESSWVVEIGFRVTAGVVCFYVTHDGRVISRDRVFKDFEILWESLLPTVIDEAIWWCVKNLKSKED